MVEELTSIRSRVMITMNLEEKGNSQFILKLMELLSFSLLITTINLL